ncbi:MAG: glycosyltransferase family 4 protein [Planctomycetes bacterium]|nr:glycosyltransferase family 4 protein [Planctomycetota bacterium]
MGDQQKKTLVVFTELFPEPENPSFVVFFYDLLRSLAPYFKITVIQPRRWHPFRGYRSKKTKVFHCIPSFEGTVIRPRMLFFPVIDRLWIRSVTFVFAALWFMIKYRNQHFAISAQMACPSGFAAVILGRLFKKPVLVTVRGSDINEYPKYPILGNMVKYTLRRACAIVAVSDDLRLKTLRMIGNTPKVITIRNGVDKTTFTPMGKAICRKELGLPLGKNIVLFVGSLIERKAIFDLLKATILIQKAINHMIIFIGDGELKDNLYREIKKNGLEKEVIIKGNVRHQEITLFMNASDVLCLPSLAEGTPNVILESLCCGLPVIASKVGGIPEVIIDSRLGILVPPGNPDELSLALKEGLQRKWDRDFIVSYSHRFSWINTAKQYHQLISEIMVKQ